MWCITPAGIVNHRICDDKSAATFKALVGDYGGWVVPDGDDGDEARDRNRGERGASRAWSPPAVFELATTPGV